MLRRYRVWPSGWKGGSRLEHLEFLRHSVDTTEHCVPVLKAYGVQVLYTYLGTGYQESGTKCPQAGAPEAGPRTRAGRILLVSLLGPRLQEEGRPY